MTDNTLYIFFVVCKMYSMLPVYLQNSSAGYFKQRTMKLSVQPGSKHCFGSSQSYALSNEAF